MCSAGISMAPGLKGLKKLDPLMGGDAILDKLGLPSLMGEKHGMLGGEQESAPEVATAEKAKSVSTDVQAARESERRRRAAASGLSSTILGGSVGTGTTGNKTLFGA
ncbi:hypothetical protein BGP80_17435 [Pseudomonas putida]|uniref:Uncharacterized protein n=2 Tax=Pseudomonas putida TaxID=303 RepID=A0A2S3WFJ2_PSEPU|nr:hypothetical protein BGP80_17435 [Pseudomonas putida]